MKNYVGRKIRGFKFEDGIDDVRWLYGKETYIGKIGEIISQYHSFVDVKFNDSRWAYPISLIEPHLIEEETPEIPQLGEGVLMDVSSVGHLWSQEKVIAMTKDGKYLDADFVRWKMARPIQQLPKYTHAELVEKIGHDFEIIK
jgi:hypothetical protein